MPEDREAILQLEARKFEFEKEMRNRELLLKEKELATVREDFQLRRRTSESSRWGNPLVVGVFVAAIAGLGNAAVSFINGYLQRQIEGQNNQAASDLEEKTAESNRILEVIKTGDPDKAAANLSFLLDAGLISSPKMIEKLRDFLTGRALGSGPALPAPATATYSFDPNAVIPPKVKSSLQDSLDSYTSFLQKLGFSVGNTVTISVANLPNWPYAEYFQAQNVILISSEVADDVDVPRLTISDDNLAGRKTDILLGSQGAVAGHGAVEIRPHRRAFDLEAGLSDYLVASFDERPQLATVAAKVRHLPTQYVHDLSIVRIYSDLVQLESLPVQVDEENSLGDSWGSLLWQVRDCLGSLATDRIASQAWLTLKWPLPDNVVATEFIKNLIVQMNGSVSAQAEARVLSIIKHQGFPLQD